MSAARPYIARGLYQQGRILPSALLAHENETGLCDTCPGELDSPESVYQRDDDPPPVPWPAFALMCAILLVALVSLHFALRWPQ